MQASYDGGDLEGGTDAARNADVASLKKLFYQEAAANPVKPDGAEKTDKTPYVSEDVAQLGLLRDVPLTRWQVVLLPHQQTVFNVFQPEYVHMFEALLALPKSKQLFLHVLLPGGVENLADPDYALPGLGIDGDAPGSKYFALQGTLMRVVAAKRQSNSKLKLIVQGLSRAVVVRGTQALPYARADVQILPDEEQLRAAARAGAAAAPNTSSAFAASPLATLAAAVTEERIWRNYEFASVELGRSVPPAFVSFDPGAVEGCAQRARALLDDAEARAEGEQSAPTRVNGDTLYAGCEAVQAALAAVTGAAEVAEAAEAAEEAKQLLSLEIQVWLELDAFLRGVAARKGGVMPVPAQLLSLLPPPPEPAGWPSESKLEELYQSLQSEAAAKRSMDSYSTKDDPEPFVPNDPALYPGRRRAQRLSFSVWAMIRAQNGDLQPVIEATSTSDRLRLALLRIRELREQIARKG